MASSTQPAEPAATVTHKLEHQSISSPQSKKLDDTKRPAPGISEVAQQRPDIASDSEKDSRQGASDEDYPPQLHAGKVGYGPHYAEQHGSATLGDKIVGLKTELKGKLTRNHDIEQHGHDKYTGEERRKKLEEDENNNTFKNLRA